MKGINRADRYLFYYSIFRKTKKQQIMFFINYALSIRLKYL